ncbi:uncharacterized protein A4U43_C04F17240 [Asparagus officinalis]|uniref:Aluminum-activated malate transporter n=1 Tax=Asparagus officinalis TaxID=4686 RepID=A0A5P1F249_ASPOF|nr:aluminum-activated malate transporter 12-like [Asparagus officinalis]ONK72234.1 uncharacterized protein A4U43_C04F17240 [Asparagus officinalis]
MMIKFRKLPASACKTLWKMGREDPRRVIHGLKVAAALTIVSFLYLLEPLFEGFGKNAMLAFMTVVVVLEFTAGATLCKGFNRGLGTLCASSLAFFIEFVAEKTGQKCRAAFVGASVFVIGFMATYLRFVPYIKKNCDYGVLIFLLTFILITLSSYRVENVLNIVRERLYTIGIGCSICLLMSLLILPNWSGEDLHSSTVCKLEQLARSIEACVSDYFKDKDIGVKEEEAETSRNLLYRGYREVLDSKSSDETLAHFASWEPRFSRNCHKYPWHLYVKLGGVLRRFGYVAVALHGCLESEIQTPRSIRYIFQDPCTQVATEVTKALTELATSLKNRRRFCPDMLSDHLHKALQDLDTAIKSQPRLFLGSKSANNMLVNWKNDKETSPRVTLPSVKSDISAILSELRHKKIAKRSKDSEERKQLRPTPSKLAIKSLEFSEALPFASFASLLVEMVARLDLVIEQVEELGNAANFKEFQGKDDVVIDMSGKENGREIQNQTTVGE